MFNVELLLWDWLASPGDPSGIESHIEDHMKTNRSQKTRNRHGTKGALEPVPVVSSNAPETPPVEIPDGLGDLARVASAGESSPGKISDLNTAATSVKFPLCDAAVRKWANDEWELADAVVAECSEPGPDGVRNESYAKINAMREEILQNHDIDLSFERLRKLRKVAATFPPGRRRPAVSLEAHLEAGSPEALDDIIINRTPAGVPLTREHIRNLKDPNEAEEKSERADERRRQIADQRLALKNLCLDLERQRDDREARYLALCRDVGKEPEPFLPVPPKDAPPTSLAEDLGQSLRVVLVAHGFDPTTADVTVVTENLVQAALAQR